MTARRLIDLDFAELEALARDAWALAARRKREQADGVGAEPDPLATVIPAEPGAAPTGRS